eukprot:13488911-Alexandrium_andersonii.AAC.1
MQLQTQPVFLASVQGDASTRSKSASGRIEMGVPIAGAASSLSGGHSPLLAGAGPTTPTKSGGSRSAGSSGIGDDTEKRRLRSQ